MLVANNLIHRIVQPFIKI